MGYIRSNEDYYCSLGYHPTEAQIQVKLDKENLNPGFCNPIKNRLIDEIEKEIIENYI